MSTRFRPAQSRRLLRHSLASLTAALAVSFGSETSSPEEWTPFIPVVRIEVAPDSVSLRIGRQTTLRALAFDSSGREVIATFAWNTSDPTIATVTRGDGTLGTVTAIAAGEATITVSTPSLSATAKVTVLPDPVAALRIVPDELILPISTTAQLTATAFDASGRPTPASIDWSSEDPSVVTVDRETGVVTAVGLGSTAVFANVGFVEASIRVRVEPADFLMQWATNAAASSEWSAVEWSAGQAIGVPDVNDCADDRAWATADPDTIDWLELTYEVPVRPTEIHIYEVWAPGSVVKVEVKNQLGVYHTVYEGTPTPHPTCLRTFSIHVTSVTDLVNAVRLTVDQRTRRDWNEIDAVQLVGYRNKQP